MQIGEAIKTLVQLKDTNIRELAEKTGLTYQAIYTSCEKDKSKGMHTTTAIRLLDELDYKLVAAPKDKRVDDDCLEIGLESTGVKRFYRKCMICGRSIPRKEYSQITPEGRVCQDCINAQFKKIIEGKETSCGTDM